MYNLRNTPMGNIKEGYEWKQGAGVRRSPKNLSELSSPVVGKQFSLDERIAMAEGFQREKEKEDYLSSLTGNPALSSIAPIGKNVGQLETEEESLSEPIKSSGGMSGGVVSGRKGVAPIKYGGMSGGYGDLVHSMGLGPETASFTQEQKIAAKKQGIDFKKGSYKWNNVLKMWSPNSNKKQEITQQEYDEMMGQRGSIPFDYKITPTLSQAEAEKWRSTYGKDSTRGYKILKEEQSGLSEPSYSSISNSFNRMGLGRIGGIGGRLGELEKSSMRLGEMARMRESKLMAQKNLMY